MLKRISVYYLCFVIAYLPAFRANAIIPVAAIAFNVVAPHIIRFTATEIAIATIARGFAANDPYYSSKGTLAKSKYLSFLNGKGKIISYVASGLIAAGFIVNESGILKSVDNSLPDGDVAPVKDFFWQYRGAEGATISEAVDIVAAANSIYYYRYTIEPYLYDNSREDLKTILVYSSDADNTNGHSGNHATLNSCSRVSGSVSTCEGGYIPPPDSRPASDTELEADFFPWLESQPLNEQQLGFANDDGSIHKDIADQLDMPIQPLMPDGSPLPLQTDLQWVYADHVANGVAQSVDASGDYYVPSEAYSDAEYLYEVVAGGNADLVASNAKGEDLTTPENPDTGSPTIPNPLPVVGPMTAVEYKAIQDSYFNDAAASLPVHDFSESENKINDAMNGFFDNSVNIEVPTWDFNPFGYLTFGGGGCIEFSFDLSIGGVPKHIVFNTHCPPYENFVRPTLEWALYLMTALNIYMIFTRTVRSI